MYRILAGLISLFIIWILLAIYWLAPELFIAIFTNFDVSDMLSITLIMSLSLFIAKRNMDTYP